MRSFFGKLGAVVAFGACVYPNASCGSRSPPNFYDIQSGGAAPASGGSAPASGGSAPASGGSGALGGTVGGGGMAANAGTNGLGGSGPFGNGGQSATGGNSGGMGNPGAPCSPAKDVSGGMSGEFGTTAGACIRVTGDITGWGCSNFDGRSVKVNDQTVTCGQLPLPGKVDGAYYFDVSGGTYDYASFYWF